LYLLSKGADPTSAIEDLCDKRKMKKKPKVISMGEGQQVKAEAAISDCRVDGGWVILNNSHLSLE